MSFNPPYWYHGNVKFTDEEIDTLKEELTRMSKVLSKDDSLKEQVTTYFIDDTTRPEKRFNNFYSKLVEDIMKNVGLYRMVRYEYIYWSQLYLKNNKHNPHQHSRKIEEPSREYEEVIISWVHFLDVPEQKCFRFVDNDGNTLVPEQQLNGDIIVFPSWVWHEVLPNESDKKRVVISGNISVTHYDDF